MSMDGYTEGNSEFSVTNQQTHTRRKVRKSLSITDADINDSDSGFENSKDGDGDYSMSTLPSKPRAK